MRNLTDEEAEIYEKWLEAEAADVQPVKRGKFIAFTDKEKYETFKDVGIPFDGRCSMCNSCLFNTDKYCSECGARMDGDTNG